MGLLLLMVAMVAEIEVVVVVRVIMDISVGGRWYDNGVGGENGVGDGGN